MTDKFDVCHTMHQNLIVPEDHQVDTTLASEEEKEVMKKQISKLHHFRDTTSTKQLPKLAFQSPEGKQHITMRSTASTKCVCRTLQTCHCQEKENDVSGDKKGNKVHCTIDPSPPNQKQSSNKKQPLKRHMYNGDECLYSDENDTRDNVCHLPQHQLLLPSKTNVAHKPSRSGKK